MLNIDTTRLLESEDDASQLQSMLQRVDTLAALAKRSVGESNVAGLALDAAQTAATICEADSYALTERKGSRTNFRRRFVELRRTPGPRVGATHDLSDEHNESSSRFALELGELLHFSDMALEERFSDEFLCRANVTSGMECPLESDGKAFGSLGIYSATGVEFSPLDANFLESIGSLLALAFARKSAEDLVELQKTRLDAISHSHDAPMFDLTSATVMRNSNPAAERLTGFTSGELEDRSFFSALILPEESEIVRQAIRKAQQGEAGVRFECTVLTKAGERRRVAWTCSGLRDDSDRAGSTFWVGVDMTQQQQTLDRVKRAEAAAENAQRALRTMQEKTLELQFGSRRHRANLSERRRKDRVPFSYTQKIAPMFGGEPPPIDSFYDVHCKDLSSYGFGFVADSVPDFQQLVVAFGRGASIIYLTAEIVHVTPEEQEYLIGCRYTGRAQY